MPTANTREKPVEKYLRQECRSAGLLCLKFTSPARRGVPDRAIVTQLFGTVFVEVKRPGGQLRRNQDAMHAKMRRFGAEVHVVDDEASVDELIRYLLGDVHPDRQKEAS